MNHALNYLDLLAKVNVQNIVLLQPTSPFRTSEDISSAIKKFKKENLDSYFLLLNVRCSFGEKEANHFIQ